MFSFVFVLIPLQYNNIKNNQPTVKYHVPMKAAAKTTKQPPLCRVLGIILALIGSVATSSSCLAFQSPIQRRYVALSMSSTTSIFQPTQSSLDKLANLKLSINKPRGVSIGIEYSPRIELSDGDLKILSMQLRKSSKAGAIFTADAESIAKLVKEQESARGDFPSPIPVIYSGSILDKNSLKKAVEGGVTAVFVNYGETLDEKVASLLNDVGIIWKISSLDEINKLVKTDSMGDVILLSKNIIDNTSEELAEILTNKKSIVAIAQIQSMMPSNAEIQIGKDLAKLGVSSLILGGACVGDEEDVKYAAYAIEQLNKKSSSNFSMTGLTGSTNGHFGVSSHGGEVKWRRNAQ